LCADGSVKLLDFGVAKILGEASAKHLAPAYRTKEGSMVGTPKYITPEQAFGDPVDARTDLYAVGLLLYALLTGRHAFDGGQEVPELIEAMRRNAAPPPSSQARQPIPAELDHAVAKALSWSAEERFPSAAAFSDALHGIAPVARPWSRGLSRPAFVLVAALSAALVLAALVLSTGGAP
jgi:serine/threonine-protein kinase